MLDGVAGYRRKSVNFDFDDVRFSTGLLHAHNARDYAITGDRRALTKRCLGNDATFVIVRENLKSSQTWGGGMRRATQESNQ